MEEFTVRLSHPAISPFKAIELFAEGVDKVTDKYWDKGYDKFHGSSRRNRGKSGREDYENERYRRQESDMDQQDPRRRYPARTPPPPRNRYDDSESDEEDYYPRDRRTGPPPRYNDGDNYRRRGRDDLPPPSNPRDAAPYAAAGAAGTGNAVAPYARSNRNTSLSRSRSRRRRRDRSYSRSRSRPRSSYNHSSDGIEATIKEQLEKNFDTSTQGLGAGLAGAAIGGWLGSRYSDQHRRDPHKERNIAAGAVVGGLAVNFLENQFQEYRRNKGDRDRGGYEKDARRGGQVYGRSRSRSRRRRSRSR
ncbi:hypothetical protein MBLNU457_g2681t1 [Dothideomycetes sp. NU457]